VSIFESLSVLLYADDMKLYAEIIGTVLFIVGQLSLNSKRMRYFNEKFQVELEANESFFFFKYKKHDGHIEKKMIKNQRMNQNNSRLYLCCYPNTKNVTLFFIFHNAYLSKTILLLETTTILYLKTKIKKPSKIKHHHVNPKCYLH
jgi:hypothetical protein